VASGLDCASPESIMDPTNLTPAGDQYSLGCVLYFCLTGQFPFPDGSSAEKMMAHQLKEPKPVTELSPEVPAELVEVVQRLMQKAPQNRFANAAEVVEALRPLAEAPVAMTAPPPPSSRASAAARASGHSEDHAAETRSVAVNAPTPRPRANVALPSRQTMHAAPPPPTHVHKAAAAETQHQPQAEVAPEEEIFEESPWGQVGLFVIAVAACAAAWIIMTMIL
jgi:serine/threonine protein kinase